MKYYYLIRKSKNQLEISSKYWIRLSLFISRNPMIVSVSIKKYFNKCFYKSIELGKGWINGDHETE